MAAQEKPTAEDVAARLVEKLPAAQRGEVQTKQGSGDYVVLRAHGRSIGTARPRSVKVTIPHDGSAAQLGAIAKVIGTVVKQVGESKTEPAADTE